MAKKLAANYDASSIEVLSGLEPVYKRPGMYTDTSSPNHIAQEVLDNSVDEALAGYAKDISVELTASGEMIVTDDGRGMPVDIHPEHKISGVELILTRLHSGAKFSDKTYKFSGGLHGVGVSVVNALSDSFKVEVWKDGKKYEMSFANGNRIGDLKEKKSKDDRTGTRISFKPNPKYFDNPDFMISRLRHLVHSKAVLCQGLKTSLIDNRTKKPKKEEWLYKKGVAEYVKASLAKKQIIPNEPWIFETEAQGSEMLVAIAWVPEGDGMHILAESYVNLIPTVLGGTHVNSLRTGLYEGVREFSSRRNLLDKNVRLTSEDVWRDCNYLLSVKIDNPHFAGQTKEKLSSEQQTAFIAAKVRDAFILWLNAHPNQAENIAKIAIENAQERIKRSQQAKRNKSKFMGVLPGKLADCLSKVPQERELFLVEGDSAGGSAKQARDKNTQAIMPLRGKILNTWELGYERIMESQEVQDIIKAIGVMPEDSDLSGLRYHKICILADADSDGMHIASLLCALFVRHFPDLVRERKVCIAMPPLYRIDQGKQVFYALDDKEKDKLVKELESKSGQTSIQRFKGLGEMNPSQLKETTMSPATRRLVVLDMDNENDIADRMAMFFSKKMVEKRREWLEERGGTVQIA